MLVYFCIIFLPRYLCPVLLPISQKWFWTVQIILEGPKLFWSGPNHFGHFQIRLFWTKFYNVCLSKMIWTRPKQIEPVKKNWYSTKIILNPEKDKALEAISTTYSTLCAYISQLCKAIHFIRALVNFTLLNNLQYRVFRIKLNYFEDLRDHLTTTFWLW